MPINAGPAFGSLLKAEDALSWTPKRAEAFPEMRKREKGAATFRWALEMGHMPIAAALS